MPMMCIYAYLHVKFLCVLVLYDCVYCVCVHEGVFV